MASVYIIPEHKVHSENRYIRANQTPIMMNNGQRFPETHDISVMLPEIISNNGYNTILTYYGIHDSFIFDKRSIEQKFWDPSILVDLMEEHFKGRVVIWEWHGAWNIGFSRRSELERYNQWIASRDQDHFFDMRQQMTTEKHAEIIEWMRENTRPVTDQPGNLAYFGGNPPGIQTSLPVSVWIEHADAAFDFKMRFIGEAVG